MDGAKFYYFTVLTVLPVLASAYILTQSVRYPVVLIVATWVGFLLAVIGLIICYSLRTATKR